MEKDKILSKAKRFYYTLKAIGKDIKNEFRTTLPNNVKKWVQASRKWSTFKSQFATSFLNEKSKIGKIKSHFKSPIIKTKIAIKSLKEVVHLFFKAMIAAGNIMNLFISRENWREVEKNLLKTKTEYKDDYLEKAKTELKELDNEALTLDQYWSKMQFLHFRIWLKTLRTSPKLQERIFCFQTLSA